MCLPESSSDEEEDMVLPDQPSASPAATAATPGNAVDPSRWTCATCTYVHEGTEGEFLMCKVCGERKVAKRPQPPPNLDASGPLKRHCNHDAGEGNFDADGGSSSNSKSRNGGGGTSASSNNQDGVGTSSSSYSRSNRAGKARATADTQGGSSSNSKSRNGGGGTSASSNNQDGVGTSSSSYSRSNRAGKARATADTQGARPSASSPPPEVPFRVGQQVEGRWWAYPGRRPTANSFWPATVQAINLDDGTVDLEYVPDRDNAAETFYRRVQLRWVRPRSEVPDTTDIPVSIVPARDVVEEPLIERRRQQNIEELKRLWVSLGLDQPLIPRRAASPPLRKPRPAPATSPAIRRQSQRGKQVDRSDCTVQNRIRSWLCGALLAWQHYALFDLLAACHGKDVASALIKDVAYQSKFTAEPLMIVIFARVGFTVIGAVILRYQSCTARARQLVEVVLTAVAPEVHCPETIVRVLDAYAEFLAHKSMHHGLLLAWRPRDEITHDDSPWGLVDAASFADVELSPPAHTAELVLHAREPRKSAWKHLQLAVSHAVAALVQSDDQAQASATSAAAAMMVSANNLADTDGGPNPENVHCEPTPGRIIALWAEMDAQFFVVRVDALREQVAGNAMANPTANASHLRVPAANEILVELSSMRWDDNAGDYVPDDKVLSNTTYMTELVRCESVVVATDREASIRCGFAIDLYGAELLVSKPWYPCGIGTDDALFAQQLHEILGACNRIESRPFEFTPELSTHYHALTAWCTDPQILFDRCMRHCSRYEEKPMSSSCLWVQTEKEPEGWRCETWDQVVERIASLNILHDDQDGSEGEELDDGPKPGTTPRTLELYCGRAGWSAHQKKRGSAAWFLDIDKTCVEPSFAAKPDYLEDGTVLCLNNLDKSKFIHCDFIDFAMAVLTDRVNIGDIHAIHDGLDWCVALSATLSIHT